MDLPHFLCIEQRRDSFEQLCEIDPLDDVHGNGKQENLKQDGDRIKRTLKSVEGEEGLLIWYLHINVTSIQHCIQSLYNHYVLFWAEKLNDSNTMRRLLIPN